MNILRLGMARFSDANYINFREGIRRCNSYIFSSIYIYNRYGQTIGLKRFSHVKPFFVRGFLLDPVSDLERIRPHTVAIAMASHEKKHDAWLLQLSRD